MLRSQSLLPSPFKCILCRLTLFLLLSTSMVILLSLCIELTNCLKCSCNKISMMSTRWKARIVDYNFTILFLAKIRRKAKYERNSIYSVLLGDANNYYSKLRNNSLMNIFPSYNVDQRLAETFFLLYYFLSSHCHIPHWNMSRGYPVYLIMTQLSLPVRS